MSSRVAIARARRAYRASSHTRGARRAAFTQTSHTLTRAQGRANLRTAATTIISIQQQQQRRGAERWANRSGAVFTIRAASTSSSPSPPPPPGRIQCARARPCDGENVNPLAPLCRSPSRRGSRSHTAFVHSTWYMPGVFTGFYTDNHLDSFFHPAQPGPGVCACENVYNTRGVNSKRIGTYVRVA